MLIVCNAGIGKAGNEVEVIEYNAIIRTFTEEREDTRMIVAELMNGTEIDLVGVPGVEDHIDLMRQMQKDYFNDAEIVDLRAKVNPIK